MRAAPAVVRRKLTVLGRQAGTVHRAFGWRGGARRAVYLAGVRSGRLVRATPVLPGYEALPPLAWSHRFDLEAVRGRYRAAGLVDGSDAVVEEASQVLDGQLRFYGGAARPVGWPPRWHSFPDGTPGPSADAHWSTVSDDLPEDVKDLWEPSRFGFTFLLARAYLLTGDERWAEAWWQSLENWMRANKPDSGVNWRCGQEASLRGIAICFGLSAFASATCTTDDRRRLAGRLLTSTHMRVRPTLQYALSQRNNHAVSELVFLLSVARRPDRRLERLLREALADQFAPDGSYSQLSLNYERLALHTLVWLLHVQPLMQARTRAAVADVLARAGSFLSRCVDPLTDRMPNSGANDGALLLDLDQTERWDAGPTLELLAVRTGHGSEASCWFPPSSIGLAPRTVTKAATSFPSLRGTRSLLLTHTGPAPHRPGDDDQQSVEIIIDGTPAVLDPGSFRYSGTGRWRQPFTGASVHNGLRPIDDVERLSMGRFLREDSSPAELLSWFDAEGNGRMVSRRRIGSLVITRFVVRIDDSYAVADHVAGSDAVATWLLPADVVRSAERFRSTVTAVEFVGAADVRPLARSDVDPASGWWSPHYGELREAVAVQCTVTANSVCVMKATPADGKPVSWQAILECMREQIDTPLFRSLEHSGVDLQVHYAQVEQPVDPELGRRPEFGDEVLKGYRWRIGVGPFPRSAHVLVAGWSQPFAWKAIARCHGAGRTLGLRFDTNARRHNRGLRGAASLSRQRLALAMADTWHPVGRSSATFARSIVPRGRPVLPVPYAVDTSLFDRPVRVRQTRSITVLAVSKLNEREGVRDLVRAAAMVDGVRLRIVGDGELRRSLTELAAMLGVDADFVGYVPYDQLASEYHAADVFAHPAHLEPWGVSVQEAMSSGLPVVASTAVGSAHELLPMQSSSWGHEPGDVEHLASNLAAMRDYRVRSAHAEANRAAAKESSIVATADALCAFLRSSVRH